jgi:hypothetical protein
MEFGDLEAGFHFVPEGRLKLDLGCYESAVPEIGSRWKLSRRATSLAQEKPGQRNNDVPKIHPKYPLLSLRPPVQIFLDYFCRRRSEFRRPSGTQAPRGPGTRR